MKEFSIDIGSRLNGNGQTVFTSIQLESVTRNFDLNMFLACAQTLLMLRRSKGKLCISVRKSLRAG